MNRRPVQDGALTPSLPSQEKENSDPQVGGSFNNFQSPAGKFPQRPVPGQPEIFITPSSILRGLPDHKERLVSGRDETRKRRRVSFAPDKDLETMHIYEIQTEEDSPPQDLHSSDIISPVPTPLSSHTPPRSPRNRSGYVFSPAPSNPDTDTMSLESSPGMPSPLDLTDCDSAAGQDGGDVTSTAALPGLDQIADDLDLGVSPARVCGQPSELCPPQDAGRSSTVDTYISPTPGSYDLPDAQGELIAGERMPLTPDELNADMTSGTATMCIADTPISVAHSPKDVTRGSTSVDEMTMGYSKIWEQGAHPKWGTESSRSVNAGGAEEDISDHAPLPSQQAQRGRWGTIPGQDDTLEIDLGQAARGQMGEATWHHVYGTGDTSCGLPEHDRVGGYSLAAEQSQDAPAKQTLGAISGSFSFESPGCAAQIPPPLSLSTSQSANALISPEASEQSRAPEEKSRAAVLSQLVAEAAATPLPDDPAPQPSAAGSLLIKEKDSSVAFADTPNGALHAGHTTRLLADGFPTGKKPGLPISSASQTPRSFGVSESLVPLSLSAGSKSSAALHPLEDSVAAGETAGLLDESKHLPVQLMSWSKASNPKSFTPVPDPETSIPPVQGDDLEREENMEYVFTSVVARSDDSTLLNSESPTQHLAQFGHIPTPSKPAAPDSFQRSTAPVSRTSLMKRSDRSRSGIEELEDKFQDLAGQLRTLKPKVLSSPAVDNQEVAAGKASQSVGNEGILASNKYHAITGGPKLARTPPPGQSYAVPSLFKLPDVPMASCSVPSCSPPTDVRSTAVPTQDLSATASTAITFRAFLDLAGVRFLDQLRRGTSGFQFGDSLSREELPKSLKSACRLMCITTADIESNEDRLKELNSSIAACKEKIGEKEDSLSSQNPAVFQVLEQAGDGDLLALRESVASLKNACRARSQMQWKHMRVQQEKKLGQRLQENRDILQQDLQLALRNSTLLEHLGSAISAFAENRSEKSTSLEAAVSQHSEPGIQHQATRGALNTGDLSRRSEMLKAKVEDLKQNIVTVREQWQKLAAQRQETVDARSCSPIHQILGQDGCLEVLQALSGWRVEGAADSLSGLSSGEVVIRNGNLARLRLQTTMGTQSGYDVKASLEIPSQQSTGLPMQHLALAARFLANGLCDGTPDSAMLSECTEVGLVLAEWTESSMLMMRTKLQGIFSSACRLDSLLDELSAVRMNCPSLSECQVSADGCWVGLRFFDLGTKCLFSVRVFLDIAYPAGRLKNESCVEFPGAHGVTTEAVDAVIAWVPEGNRRLESACRALSQLVRGPVQASTA